MDKMVGGSVDKVMGGPWTRWWGSMDEVVKIAMVAGVRWEGSETKY